MAEAADIVIRNASVLTMDDEAPRAQAVAITGNRITFAGTNEDAETLVGAATRTVDALGATVMPGFNESHMHIFEGSLSLTQLLLLGVHGFDAVKAATLAYAAANPDLPLLTGVLADYHILGSRRATRHDLDRIIADRPFVMIAPDHHTAWANTMALETAGILHGAAVGVGNEIVMGADGLATGELLESDAFGPVLRLGITGGRESMGILTGGDPEHVSTDERRGDMAIIKDGLAYCASLGITSLQNMDGNLYQLEMFEDIERETGLPVRIRMPFHMKNAMPLAAIEEKAAVWRQRFASDRLKCDFVKLFADGVVESGTAHFVGGYGDAPDENGQLLFSTEMLNAIVDKVDKLGLQVAVHAIGSGAVRQVINAYEQAAATNGPRDRRHRIEHIETIEPSDIKRLASAGIVASMQPTHAPGTGEVPLEPYVSRIGESRWPHAFAWKAIVEAGTKLVVGTDWPVTSVNPFECIEAAMTRRLWRDDQPDQRLPLLDILTAYTRTGAWVEFMEDRKGRLKPGYLADLIVLDRDIEMTPSIQIGHIRPSLTICDGQIVFESS